MHYQELTQHMTLTTGYIKKTLMNATYIYRSLKTKRYRGSISKEHTKVGMSSQETLQQLRAIILDQLPHPFSAN